MPFKHSHPPASDVPRNEASPDAKAYYPLTSPAAGTALLEVGNPETLPLLFTPITIGGLLFKNRIFVAPCVSQCSRLVAS